MAAQVPGAPPHEGFLPKGFGREFGTRMLEVLPEIREAVRGIGQDIRPMLPAAKQLQMAGEMMAFKTAMDGFEETMKKWSTGEVQDYSDPFQQNRDKQEPARDENGLTEEVKRARSAAEERLKRDRTEVFAWFLGGRRSRGTLVRELENYGWREFLNRVKSRMVALAPP